jgi:hypothetical protein
MTRARRVFFSYGRSAFTLLLLLALAGCATKTEVPSKPIALPVVNEAALAPELRAQIEAAAKAEDQLGLQVLVVKASSAGDFEAVQAIARAAVTTADKHKNGRSALTEILKFAVAANREKTNEIILPFLVSAAKVDDGATLTTVIQAAVSVNPAKVSEIPHFVLPAIKDANPALFEFK